jgi:class 3 adenylate cyclase
MRYGIHTGSVVAGVIGKRKFSYDLWGDTVNTAARMESHGIPDAIQVTEDVYETLRDRYSFTPRGPVQIRGKGEMSTYLLEARIAKAVSSSLHS